MNLYAESSAVLAWLLDEPTAPTVGEILARAKDVLTSELTPVECDRALLRRLSWNQCTEEQAETARLRLREAVAHWAMVELRGRVLDEARRPLPNEPVKTLDALHLASALVARDGLPDIALLTLDDRIRECGTSLGFEILPDQQTPDPESAASPDTESTSAAVPKPGKTSE